MNGYREVGSALVVRRGEGWSLLAARCAACGFVAFPSVVACPECNGVHFDSAVTPDTGSLYTFSMIHTAQKGWKVPYAAGYVDLAESLRVFGRLELPEDELRIGMPLTLSVRPVDASATRFTYAFVAPAEAVAGANS